MTASPEPPPAAPAAGWLRWAPTAFALLVLGFYLAPLYSDLSSWAGTFDLGYYFFVNEVDRNTILRHGQFPLWNPYYCGGAPQFASPQTGVLSPLFPLLLIFGPALGARLAYTVTVLAAFDGMRRFSGALGLSQPAATVAGAGFGICGALAQHLGGGHWGWASFALFPYLLFSFHRVLDDRCRTHIVFGALALAGIIFHWGIYPLPYALMTLGIYALAVGLTDRRKLLRAVVVAAQIAVLGLAFGAVRLLPLFEFVSTHPRPVVDRDWTNPLEFGLIYGWRYSYRGFGNHQYVYPEYGNYFGLGGVLLFFTGLVLVFRTKRRVLIPIVAATVIFLVFQLGNLVPLPWWLLRKLPIFRNLRVPSRFTIVAGMFACVLIGYAIDQLGTPALRRWRALPKKGRIIGAAVLVLAAGYLVDASSFNRLQWGQTFGTPAPRDSALPQFKQTAGDKYRMWMYPRMNKGSLRCFEESPLPISPALNHDLPADEYLQDPQAGKISRVLWSPNKIVLAVELARPTTVIVNQNFDKHWRARGTPGRPVSHRGLLAAALPAGKHQLTFYYLPNPVLAGLAITLAAAVLTVTTVVVLRRRRRLQAPRRAALSRADDV